MSEKEKSRSEKEDLNNKRDGSSELEESQFDDYVEDIYLLFEEKEMTEDSDYPSAGTDLADTESLVKKPCAEDELKEIPLDVPSMKEYCENEEPNSELKPIAIDINDWELDEVIEKQDTTKINNDDHSDPETPDSSALQNLEIIIPDTPFIPIIVTPFVTVTKLGYRENIPCRNLDPEVAELLCALLWSYYSTVMSETTGLLMMSENPSNTSSEVEENILTSTYVEKNDDNLVSDQKSIPDARLNDKDENVEKVEVEDQDNMYEDQDNIPSSEDLNQDIRKTDDVEKEKHDGEDSD